MRRTAGRGATPLTRVGNDGYHPGSGISGSSHALFCPLPVRAVPGFGEAGAGRNAFGGTPGMRESLFDGAGISNDPGDFTLARLVKRFWK